MARRRGGGEKEDGDVKDVVGLWGRGGSKGDGEGEMRGGLGLGDGVGPLHTYVRTMTDSGNARSSQRRAKTAAAFGAARIRTRTYVRKLAAESPSGIRVQLAVRPHIDRPCC